MPTAFVEFYHHPDEVWQYLEAAHRLAFGTGVIPWEYRAGMRSWLIPLAIAGPMAAGKLLWPTSILYLVPVRLTLIGLSLAIPVCGAAIALRVSRLHGLVVGLVLATSMELLYFSARALSDSVAAGLFFAALWALLPRDRPEHRRLFLGGLLLGLSFSARIQLAPTVAVVAFACCRGERRVWITVVCGGLAGLVAGGAADAVCGATPLAWIWRNVRLNLVENRSAVYGVEPPLWYVTNQLRLWWWAAIPLLVLVAIGARKFPVLLVAALTNIVVHSLIPHKEFRFIFLSVALLLMLAGVGTADMLRAASSRRPSGKLVFGALAALFWSSCFAAAAFSPGGGEQWHASFKNIAVLRTANAVRACGLAYFQPSTALTAAYVYYDRRTPIYVFNRASASRDIQAQARAFNVVVTSRDRGWELPPGYRLLACFPARPHAGSSLKDIPDRCLFVRPGNCQSATDRSFLINAEVARANE